MGLVENPEVDHALPADHSSPVVLPCYPASDFVESSLRSRRHPTDNPAAHSGLRFELHAIRSHPKADSERHDFRTSPRLPSYQELSLNRETAARGNEKRKYPETFRALEQEREEATETLQSTSKCATPRNSAEASISVTVADKDGNIPARERRKQRPPTKIRPLSYQRSIKVVLHGACRPA